MDGLLKAFQVFWRENGEMASVKGRVNDPSSHNDGKASSNSFLSAKDGKITRENGDASRDCQPRVLSHEGVAHPLLLGFYGEPLMAGLTRSVGSSPWVSKGLTFSLRIKDATILWKLRSRAFKA
jgi:hypothetical protein